MNRHALTAIEPKAERSALAPAASCLLSVLSPAEASCASCLLGVVLC